MKLHLEKKKWWILAAAAVALLLYLLLGKSQTFEMGSSGSSVGTADYDKMAYDESFYAYPESAERSIAPSPIDGGGFAVSPTGDQKVIRTSNLSLHVEDVRETVESVKVKVTEWGGYLENVNVNRYETFYEASMTLRVAKDKLDAAVAELKEMAIYVDSEYSNSSDITETYLDLEARLNNFRAEEEQYVALLERAETLELVVELTNALYTVRAEIESLESRLKYYDTQVDYSTIYLTLTEDPSASVATETWRPISTIRTAVKDWIVSLQVLADKLIYVGIYGWPILLIVLAVWLFRGKKRR